MFKSLIAALAARFYNSLVPSEDRLSDMFDKVQQGLANTRANAERALEAERKVREASFVRENDLRAKEHATRSASYDRSATTHGVLARATRVSGRLDELFA